MLNKSIQYIIAPPPPHFVGDGFRVHNFFPGAIQGGMQRTDPFLLMDYGAPHYFPPSDQPRGVGVHPHRGFETVTIAYKGSVAHRDSAGNGGIINPGDVQWMTAASGVLHEEFHEEEFTKKGGEMQMVQLWVNLPAKDKMSKPGYQAITNDSIPRFKEKDIEIEIIAGTYKGIGGSAKTHTDVHMYNVSMQAGSKAEFEFPSHFTTCLLVIEGDISIDNKTVPTHHFVLFSNDEEQCSFQAINNAKVLLLAGEPIQEPIAAHGPFVMNTREEIMQAFMDFQEGKFGSM